MGRENLVGSENGALLCMMRNLEIERVTLAAMGLGIARCEYFRVETGEEGKKAERRFHFSWNHCPPAAVNPSSVCGGASSCLCCLHLVLG